MSFLLKLITKFFKLGLLFAGFFIKLYLFNCGCPSSHYVQLKMQNALFLFIIIKYGNFTANLAGEKLPHATKQFRKSEVGAMELFYAYTAVYHN